MVEIKGASGCLSGMVNEGLFKVTVMLGPGW